MGKIYQVTVNDFRGEKIVIDLCNTEEQMNSVTVLQLKEKIVERLADGTTVDTLRLIFLDKILDGDSTLLSSYGICHGSAILCVLRVPGGGMSRSRENLANFWKKN